MAPHRAGRATGRVDEHRIDAPVPERRRLKIGGNALNRHSRQPRRVGEPTHALVAGITGEDPGTGRLEGDGLSSRRRAGVVHQRTCGDSGESRDEGVCWVLDDEGSFGEARQGLGPRAWGPGAVNLETCAEWCVNRFYASVVELL